jgi:hypothetical protein
LPRCEGNGLFELGKYAREATKAIAQRVKHAQEPLIINFGQDTPVYRLP